MEEFEDFGWVEKFSSKSIKIPFGSKICRKILDQEFGQEFRKRTEDLILDSLTTNGKLSCRSAIQGGFPGSLAVAVLRSKLQDMSQENYKVFFKTDGQRYFLCFVTLTSKEDKKEYLCYAINRSNEYFILSIHGLTPAVYDGTILDGELIKTSTGSFEFQVFDCILGCKKPTMQKGHPERLRVANECLSTLKGKPELQDKNPFTIVCKEYVSIEEIISWRSGEKKHYDTDGLIFVDTTREYVFGKDEHLLKWKSIYTVDFTVEIKKISSQDDIGSDPSETCWEYNLFTFQKGNKRKHQCKGIANSSWLEYFEDKNHEYVRNDLASMDGMIVECIWKKESWFPYRIRTDKSNANNDETYQLTLQNIKEDIQFKEIAKILGVK